MNELSIVELVYYLIQIVLAIVIFWYTLETKLMRKASEEQLKELVASRMLINTPYLTAGFTIYNSFRDLTCHFHDNKGFLPSGAEEYFLQQINEKQIYKINIENYVDTLALDVKCYMYDYQDKCYLKSFTDLNAVKSGVEQNIYGCFKDSLPKSDVFEHVQKYFGCKPQWKELFTIPESDEPEEKDYLIILVFKNVANEIFATKTIHRQRNYSLEIRSVENLRLAS